MRAPSVEGGALRVSAWMEIRWCEAVCGTARSLLRQPPDRARVVRAPVRRWPMVHAPAACGGVYLGHDRQRPVGVAQVVHTADRRLPRAVAAAACLAQALPGHGFIISSRSWRVVSCRQAFSWSGRRAGLRAIHRAGRVPALRGDRLLAGLALEVLAEDRRRVVAERCRAVRTLLLGDCAAASRFRAARLPRRAAPTGCPTVRMPAMPRRVGGCSTCVARIRASRSTCRAALAPATGPSGTSGERGDSLGSYPMDH